MHKSFARRIMALALSVCMIAGMIDLTGFTVRAEGGSLDGGTITLDDTADLTYTGGEIEPAVKEVKDMLDNIIDASSYTVSYRNNINVTTRAEVIVEGTGTYSGSITAYFTITPKDISGCTLEIQNPNDQTIVTDGTEVRPAVTVKDGTKELVLGTDYTLSYENNTTAGTNAKVIATGRGNYTGSLEGTFTIERLEESKFSVGTLGVQIYNNGEAKEPDVGKVTYDGKELTLGKDYTVRYEDNFFATLHAKAIIEGKGKYHGLTKTVEFSIRKGLGKSGAGITYTKPVYVQPIPEQSYKGGEPVTFDASYLTVIDPDYPSTPLTPGDDYEITKWNKNDIETTEASVTITGKGAYSGSLEVFFTISAAQISGCTLSIEDQDTFVYDGATDWSTTAVNNLKVTNGGGTYTYTKDKDYTVAPVTSAVNAGTYQLRVTPKAGGQLKGNPVTVAYTVAPRNIGTLTPSLGTDYPTGGYTYNGRAMQPGLVITHNSKTLIAGTDYDLHYTNNINASTEAVVYAEGKGNYTGRTVEVNFTIKPIELTNNASVSITGLNKNQTYTGRDIEPSINVYYAGKGNLTKDKDYTVAYSNNREVGTATITITGINNYSGTLTDTFTINQRDLKDVVISSIPSEEYTGQIHTPRPTLTYSGYTLLETTDYELEYGENINVGTGTVKITGTGNFTGKVTKQFSITACNIANNLTVTDTREGFVFTEGTAEDRVYKYTSNAIEPELEVIYNFSDGRTQTLVQGEDYRITYTRNTAIGTAQVTLTALTGSGKNFTGTNSLTFCIKGDLSDNDVADGFTQVEIPEQIYTHQPVVPADVKVTFDGTALKQGRDYTVECRNGDNENVGTATAVIVGNGDYYNETTDIEFHIREMDLSQDDLEENGYAISGVEESYVYSGLPVHPNPTITHNGVTLAANSEYRLISDPVIDPDDPSQLWDNVNVGQGKLTIEGNAPNYKGSKDVTYDITEYDISASYAQNYVEITGVEDVVLEDVLAGTSTAAEMKENTDQVVQKNLQVMYTPVDIDGTVGTQRELTADEYDVTYENNTTIGTATITITGKGNFKGNITKDFKIRGDLSGENVSVTVDDWTYTPAANGVSTNTPEPVVTYTRTYRTGAKEETVLTKDTDYQVSYEDNENVTLGDARAKVIVKGLTDAATGDPAGDYVGENSAEFKIEQRDLSYAVGDEDVKDPLLNVTGLVEDGYEYTGSPIIPELVVTCNESPLIAGSGDGIYDYEITAANNTNVYEYEETDEGAPGERLTPVVTVSAKKDENGEYTGNYKGEFQMEFKVNPREISQETIDNLVPVAGVDEAYDYTGNPVTIPSGNDDGLNGIIVTWSKNQGEETLLVENRDYTIAYRDNVKIGVATIEIAAKDKSNYTGSYEKTFKIMASIEVVDAENEADRYITLTYNHDVPYGIVEVYPEMRFMDYSPVLCGESTDPKILEEGVDFEVVTAENQGDAPYASINNINVAGEDDEDESKRPTAVIRGIGCYRGVIKKFYNIIPKNLTTDDGDVTASFTGSINNDSYENAYVYTGEEIEPEVIVYNHGQAMTPGRDYTVKGFVNNTEISTEDKKAGVVIEAAEGSNYTGTKTLYFNIIPKPVEEMTLTVLGEAQVFDRTEKKPKVELSYTENNQKVVLTEGQDYELTYENNVNAARGNSGESAPKVIATGKGSYGGTKSATFTIEPESLNEDNDDFVITGKNAVYTGSPVTTTFEVKAKDGTTLEEGVDYELGAYSDNTQAGTGYVTISGKGNYTGSRRAPFYILPSTDGEFKIAEIPAETYNTKPHTPEVSVEWQSKDGDISIPLTEDNDYKVTYSNNINAGTATVTVTGTGNFGSTKTATFTINKKNIGTVGAPASDMILDAVADQQYTGRGVTPVAKVTFQNTTEGINKVLVVNSDYKLTYTSNVAVGTATAIVTGINNYSGTMQTTFRILGNVSKATVDKIPVQQYTGEAVYPVPVVNFAGKKLTEDTDYTLEYRNNVERGTASIVITGKGWYTGSQTVTFDIAREFSSETSVRGVASAYTYTGSAIKPTVMVIDNGAVLTNGTDYKVSYSNNVNAGNGTVTITGINKYSGTRKVTFKITPQQLGRATVAKIADQSYNGKKKEPKVTVKSGNITLKKGTDYTTVYVNSTKPGKASVIIKGKGNFTGTQTLNYNIVVPKVTGVKAAKYTDTSITFSWKKNSVASGFEIYNSKNKRVARVMKKTATKATVSKLKAGSTGTFRIRAIVNTGGQYYFGAFTKIKASTGPKATTISSLTSRKSKQAVVKWKKVSGATQYEVYRSTSAKGKYKKIATTKKTSYTDKKATGGKKYYYKIRVCKTISKKNYYSDYSSAKSVTAKK